MQYLAVLFILHYRKLIGFQFNRDLVRTLNPFNCLQIMDTTNN